MIEIVPFEDSMQQSVEALILKGLRERWGHDDPSLNPDVRNIASHYAPGEMMVAYLDGEVVGSGAVVSEAEQIGRVVRMSVRSELQGQGIGKQILARLESEALDRGYNTLVLETTETWTDAIAFYQSQGYEIQNFKDGDAHFEKRLAS